MHSRAHIPRHADAHRYIRCWPGLSILFLRRRPLLDREGHSDGGVGDMRGEGRETDGQVGERDGGGYSDTFTSTSCVSLRGIWLNTHHYGPIVAVLVIGKAGESVQQHHERDHVNP